jgi:hypothetical protein
MKKNDFTPEFVRDKLIDYNVNQNFPHDELDEIGSKVYIDNICDVEIHSVREADSNFIVDGAATLETETDLGEGDAWSDNYPMEFSYEFDENGAIVRQLIQTIDTSSFFAGNDDYESRLVTPSGHQTAFQTSVMDILSLLAQPIEAPPDKNNLRRLLYINVITILECYLSGFFISRVREDRKLLRKLIETTPTFKEQKLSVSDVFETMEAIDKRADSYLTGLVWHRVKDVSALYERVLGVNFPSDMQALRNAIAVRHELVHRNGKKRDGTEHEISESEIQSVVKLAEAMVEHVERRWLAISSAV